MKTYQECVREYDDWIPHRADLYMLGFLDAIAFVFDKHRAQVIKDVQAYRSERDYEEDETSEALPSIQRRPSDRDPIYERMTGNDVQHAPRSTPCLDPWPPRLGGSQPSSKLCLRTSLRSAASPASSINGSVIQLPGCMSVRVPHFRG